jgi:hypothetical protein
VEHKNKRTRTMPCPKAVARIHLQVSVHHSILPVLTWMTVLPQPKGLNHSMIPGSKCVLHPGQVAQLCAGPRRVASGVTALWRVPGGTGKSLRQPGAKS